MIAPERQKVILDYLNTNQTATTQCLCQLTGASPATLRRDLSGMAQKGLLKKVHGGAQKLAANECPEPSGSSCVAAFDPFLSSKDAIAKKACEFIQTGDIIFIGAGMTCNLLCRYLLQNQKEKLTVVTTNITAVTELASAPWITILVLGGTVHTGPNHIETLDDYTMQFLETLYFDKIFFTVDGIDPVYGYSIINRAQVPLYHHLIKNTGEAYLLASEGKFDKRTFTHLCGLDGISSVIVNSSVSQTYLTWYREHGIHLHIA